MDISQILSSLSPEDMQNLQSLASSLMSESDPKQQAPPPPPKQAQANPFEGIDLNMLGNMTSMLSAFSNSANDPRCQLILSLKPLLSEEKRHRADEAVKIIKLMDLLPLLRETGLFG